MPKKSNPESKFLDKIYNILDVHLVNEDKNFN